MTPRAEPAAACGRGNDTITDDGCPVEIYAALPCAGEAEIVRGAIARGSSVLELGCGAGRIAEPLAELGYEVVGVDSSPAMLAKLRAVQGVCSSIEGLRLGRTFDVVLLASHLVNTHDRTQREVFLAVAREHLESDGTLIVQRYLPEYRPVATGPWHAGDVELELREVVEHGSGVFSAMLVHRLGELTAEQEFSAQILDDQALIDALLSSGFDDVQWLTSDGGWVRATAVPEAPA